MKASAQTVEEGYTRRAKCASTPMRDMLSKFEKPQEGQGLKPGRGGRHGSRRRLLSGDTDPTVHGQGKVSASARSNAGPFKEFGTERENTPEGQEEARQTWEDQQGSSCHREMTVAGNAGRWRETAAVRMCFAQD